MAAKNHTSQVTYQSARFLITDRPSDTNLKDYLQILKQNNVVALARVCEPSYDKSLLEEAGIVVRDLAFADGEPPPGDIVDEWLKLNDEAFAKEGACVAVHCVAGLGRAPVLVAVSLMERGMQAEDAVLHIRKTRRGAINTKQIAYLRKYKLRRKGKGKDNSGGCLCM
eukprot:m.477386 g.477386  ORF g.477386 m.477386 type:complete len:168 (-) comp20827_c0_seq1:281-784(-)